MRNNVPYCTHDKFLYEMHDPEGVDLTSNILSHIIKPFDRKKKSNVSLKKSQAVQSTDYFMQYVCTAIGNEIHFQTYEGEKSYITNENMMNESIFFNIFCLPAGNHTCRVFVPIK